MSRRLIKYIMAALLSLLMVVPTMGSAHADTLCDTTCIYNTLANHQIPAHSDGSQNIVPAIGIRYYTGPNGLEIRLSRDATWRAAAVVGVGSSFAVGSVIAGTTATIGEVAAAAVIPEKLLGAAKIVGAVAAAAGLPDVIRALLQEDWCLGITIPPDGIQSTMNRAIQLHALNPLGLSPQTADDIHVWFESCSYERVAGLADTVTQPLGIMSGNLQEETSAQAIPVTGGSASTMTSLGRDVLTPGQKMYPNQYLTSLDGRFVLALQNDGNLVAYGPGYVPIWSSGTSGRSVDCLMAQTDGNIVMYGAGNVGPIWATNTESSGGASLKMQEDGNVVVYNSSGVSQWSSGTTRATTGGTYDGSFQLTDGQWLRPGHYLRSGDFRYTLYLQNDGNLVFYSAGKRQWWTSNTGGPPNVEGLLMQSDGNLVLYAQGAIWATNTGGPGPHKLLLQNDGNMVLYGGNGATWSTGTAGKI